MKAGMNWNAAPYAPCDRPEKMLRPYICALRPGKAGFAFEIQDTAAPEEIHTLYYRVRGEEKFIPVSPDQQRQGRLDGLLDQTDYECCVVRETDGCRSEIRLVRTGEVPGIVVNYLHPEDSVYSFSGNYLCSPSLCRLPEGRLISSMDVYGYDKAQNLTLLFYSEDDGKSWHYLTELFPCFWGRLFYRNGKLYMLACSRIYGDLLIGKSEDGGKTWGAPTVLFRGGCCNGERGFHRAPMPLIEAGGRIRTAVEYGTWEQQEFNNAVLSAPADCTDYTDPSVWVCTPFWRACSDPAVPEEKRGTVGIEGNVVEAPDGSLYNFLRFRNGECLRLHVDKEDPEAPLSYADTVQMKITTSKFEIQRDEQTGDYFALCSRMLDQPQTFRNLLGLFRSPDLVHWTCVADLLGSTAFDTQKIGFQYVSFLMEGEDILYLSRTAWNGANNSHDSNFQTFHRVCGFRQLGQQTKIQAI